MAAEEPLGAPVAPDLVEEAIEADSEDAEAYLQRTAAKLKEQNLTVTWEVTQGDAASAIVNAARQNGCDLIVMATHGHSGLRRLVLGSVADQVLRDAHVPLLLVRPEHKET
jgi:nucleotide-binding universal stress UspA family protein